MVYVVCIIVGWSKIDPTLDWSSRAVIIYFKQYNCYGTILNTQWGYSTNADKVFKLILDIADKTAKINKPHRK